MTGASSGLGVETARALTAAGADVTLAVRNVATGDAVAQTIEKSTGANRPHVFRLDLADLDCVTHFVEMWGGPLHLLVNNAGLVTGGVATGLQRNFTARQRESLDAAEATGVFSYKTVEQGAATTIVAAVAPQFARTGGHYLDDGREAYTVANAAELARHPHGVKQWALDPESATRLWLVSADLTGRLAYRGTADR